MTAIGDHYLRNRTPANADAAKKELNEHHMKTGKTLTQDVNDYIKESGAKVRKNSVKLVDVILSGSHEKMKEIESDPKKFKKWVEANKAFAEKEFGKENIRVFSVHRDERTPHIHLAFVPIVEKEKRWKNQNGEGVKREKSLSARDFIGGEHGNDKLKQLHGRYAQAMQSFGLSRGVEGSRAKHETIKEFYGRVNDPISAEISTKIEQKAFGRGKSVKVDKNDLKQLILAKKEYQERAEKAEKEAKRKQASIAEYNKKLTEEKKTREELARRKGIDLANQVLKKAQIPLKITSNFEVVSTKKGPQQKR